MPNEMKPRPTMMPLGTTAVAHPLHVQKVPLEVQVEAVVAVSSPVYGL